MKKRNLLGCTLSELIELAVSLGEKPFRGRQLYQQIYRRRILDFQAMTDLAKDFRRRLQQEFRLELPRISRRTCSRDGTVKYLLELEDGRFIESVYIPEERRETLCISSQVGCDVGCTFCMTAQMGFIRNLKAGEILGQILAVEAGGDIKGKSYNIVFMGMGEPLYNYKQVRKAFSLMIDPQGMGLSHRRITISTSGVVPVLLRMGKEKPLPNLAISLNATEDPLRDRIMPLNRRWPLEELLRACRKLPLEPRRRLTFEYVLLGGLTDSDEDALRLVRLLKGFKAKVNLIPYNPNPGLPYRRPSQDRVERFREILLEQGLGVFVRKTRGSDVGAACGQLAYLEEGLQHA